MALRPARVPAPHLAPTRVDAHPPLRGLARAQLALAGSRYADVVAAELDGTPRVDEVRRAARELATHHALLRARLDALHTPVLVRADVDDPLPVHVVLGDWRATMEELLASPLALGRTVWRLVVVIEDGHTHLLLAVHHALVDGRTMGRLMHDLLTALATPDALGAPTPLPPALLDVATPPRWLRWTAPLLRRAWAWRIRRHHRQPALAGRRLSDDEDAPTLFHDVVLADGLTARLREHARQRGATVGGALAAAAWEATDRAMRRRGGAVPFSIDALVDARAASDDLPAVGMYAGGVVALTSGRTDDDPWTRAATASANVRDQVAWGVPLLAHVLADGVAQPATWLASRGVDLDAHGGSGSVAQVSSSGVWPHPTQYGRWRLVALRSATPAVRTGPTLIAWLRTTGDTTTLSAIGNGAVVTRGELARWIDDLVEQLTVMGFTAAAWDRT